MGESIELNPDIATEQCLQDYIDPEVNIGDKPADNDTVPINKFDPHGHVIFWIGYFQIFMYLKYVKKYHTSFSYMV